MSEPEIKLLLIARNDDPELLEWLLNAERLGRGFVSRFAGACLRADSDNYRLVRPALLQMREKYPDYKPTDAVKLEIAERLR